ncbi:glycosyltransferase [Sphingomonas sp.]|uniref:glycosyltransferase n=1 Tax=Sphingomonas sp. TaxID=28214 RepID=UPI0035C8263D
MTTPAIAAVHRMTGGWHAPPRIVTITRKPAAALLVQVFGEGAVHNLILDEGAVLLRSAGQEQTFDTLIAATAAIVAAAEDGLMLRFVDPATVRLIELDAPALLDAARAVWLQLRDPDAGEMVRRRLAQRGFLHRLSSDLPPAEIMARVPIVHDPLPDYTLARRRRLNTLVLLDNNLTGERGHYLPVAQRITTGALQAGARVVWAANRRLDRASVPKGVEMEGVFETSVFDLSVAEQQGADLSPEIARGWRAVIDKYDTPTTHYLVQTTDGHFVRALDTMLADGMPRGVVHLSTPYETRHMPARQAGRELDWYLARLGNHSAFGDRLFLWAETSALASLLSSRLGKPVSALPLPAPAWTPDAVSERAGPLTLAFVGEARLDKGPLELPAILAAIAAAVPPRSVRLIVQRVAPFGGANEPLQAALEAIAAVPMVETIDETLDDDAYRRLIVGSDVVLLPYRPENYAVRGSGIIAEALAAGRIILGSAGTIVEEFTDEGVVVACRTPEEWARAVCDILRNRAEIQQRALRMGRRYAKRNAPRAYVDRLAARTEFARASA